LTGIQTLIATIRDVHGRAENDGLEEHEAEFIALRWPNTTLVVGVHADHRNVTCVENGLCIQRLAPDNEQPNEQGP